MQKLKLLMVEDSEDDAELVLRVLRKGGYEPTFSRVERREDMEEALLSGSWDVVLSDHQLPRFSSSAALQCLKRVGVDIPFIIVSGSIGEEVAIQAMREGAQDYILKDSLARLPSAVEREVREARTRRSRRELESALRKSEDLYSLIVRLTSDVVWELDTASDKIWWNESLHRVFGYSPDPCQALAKWFYERIHPEELAEVQGSFRDFLSSGETEWSAEYRFRRADGAYSYVHNRAFRTHDQRIVGAMMDISTRKKLEGQLRQSQKMEAFGQLAGGIAHDFNNLLTAIISPAAMLRRAIQDSEQKKWVEMIRQAADSATKLVNQLLAFSRQQTTEPIPLDVNAVIGEVRDMLERIIGENVEVILRLGEDLGTVRADKGQLEQVLINLAINARDAMPAGGTLTIETSWELSTEDKQEVVLFTVADTGTGMTKDVQARLFEPFFTTKAPGKGTGLGLATCFGIVSQAGGRITVKSEPGEGSAFTVRLPRIRGPAAPPEPGGAARAELEGTETLLLVEDEPLVRNMAAALLRDYGYQVLEAEDGREAVSVMKKGWRIDLVITDLQLPGMNGEALAEEIRKQYPGTRVLFTSGFSQLSTQPDPCRRDCDFITKPFSPEALLSKVRSLLDV